MARGQFLQDLSSGIFERLGQVRQEQEAQDAQGKASVINMLAGLADKIEPEGLPMLMGHIWDTIGIKKQATGKGLRGFLDAFSGAPNRSVEDQLGTKFRELTGSFVGPQTAKDTRLRNNIAQKGIPGLVNAAPDSGYGLKAAGDVQDLQNKMIFRDPYQQKIDEIQARYGAQLEKETFMLGQRSEAALNKQKDLYDRRDVENKANYDRKLTFARDQLVKRYINDPEIQSLPVNERLGAAQRKADQEIEEERERKGRNVESQITLREKIGNRADREATGGTPSQQLAKDKFEYTKGKDRNKYQEDFNSAQATINTLTTQLESEGKAVDDWAKKFKRTREQLLGSSFAKTGPIGKAVDAYNKTRTALEAAKATLETKRKELEGFDKDQGGGPSKLEAVPPAKPQRKGGGIRVRQEQGVSQGYMPGDIRDISGKKYVVRELKNGFWILDPK